MKQVKNKMTGDIGELDFDSKEGVFIVVRYDLLTKVTSKSYYKNLKDLNKEWEDYEEPKEYWFIDIRYPKVEPKKDINLSNSMRKRLKEIGNYFGTKEEAEKVVEKLKAWKRLKDNGFKFTAYQLQELNIKFFLDHGYTKMGDDLDLLFGGRQ